MTSKIKSWRERFSSQYPNFPVENVEAANRLYWMELEIADLRSALIAAHPANGAQAGLSDEQIVTALHSLGVDTYPSKFGFSTLQVSATSVPTIRQLVELLAAPQKKEG